MPGPRSADAFCTRPPRSGTWASCFSWLTLPLLSSSTTFFVRITHRSQPRACAPVASRLVDQAGKVLGTEDMEGQGGFQQALLHRQQLPAAYRLPVRRQSMFEKEIAGASADDSTDARGAGAAAFGEMASSGGAASSMNFPGKTAAQSSTRRTAHRRGSLASSPGSRLSKVKVAWLTGFTENERSRVEAAAAMDSRNEPGGPSELGGGEGGRRGGMGASSSAGYDSSRRKSRRHSISLTGTRPNAAGEPLLRRDQAVVPARSPTFSMPSERQRPPPDPASDEHSQQRHGVHETFRRIRKSAAATTGMHRAFTLHGHGSHHDREADVQRQGEAHSSAVAEHLGAYASRQPRASLAGRQRMLAGHSDDVGMGVLNMSSGDLADALTACVEKCPVPQVDLIMIGAAWELRVLFSHFLFINHVGPLRDPRIP